MMMQTTNQIVIRQIFDAIRPCISAIYTFNCLNNRVVNGTIFFVNHNNIIYALTAHHVHTDLKIFENGLINDKVYISKSNGSSFKNLNPEIAYEDKEKDLIIYQINALSQCISPFSGNLLQNNGDLSQGTTLATMGFPGVARIQNKNNISFGIYSAMPILDSISGEGVININIDKDNMESVDAMNIPAANFELGGMSGAPIFFIRHNIIETWDLCGIVTQSLFDNTNFGGAIISNQLFIHI